MSAKKDKHTFAHEIGDVVLVKWDDGMVYFAKIKRIDSRKRQCVVIFDDKSSDKASFSQIHSVDETTTDIICIKCKRDNSEVPNEIVLCDGCGIGFHQKCHSPTIPASAVELNNPWKCIYCQKGVKNPYFTESIDAMQSLFEDTEEISKRENLIIKQEVISDDDQDTSSTYTQQSVVQSPPKKRRPGRPPLSDKSGKRPLQVLRRKFAKARLGHSAITPRNNSPKLNQQNLFNSSANNDSMEVSNTPEQPTDMLSTRKRRGPGAAAVFTECLSEEICASVEEVTDDYSNSESSDLMEPPRLKKRPRSLRVSLTLPPSVETTPVSNRVNVAVSELITVNEPPSEKTSSPPACDKEESVESMELSTTDTTPEATTINTSITTTEPPAEKPSDNPTLLKTTQSSDTPSIDHTVTSSTITVPGVTTQSTTSCVNTLERPTTLFSKPSTDNTLVKVSPGVTQLRPAKQRALSTGSENAVPVSTTSMSSIAALSPLERLQHEVATLNKNAKFNAKHSISKPVIALQKAPDSCATTVMQTTGTITSTPLIQSNVQHSHHSRKSSVPSRTVSISPVTSIHKPKPQKKNSNDGSQTPIVISPSPSPPLPATSNTASGCSQSDPSVSINQPPITNKVYNHYVQINDTSDTASKVQMTDQSTNTIMVPSLTPVQPAHQSKVYPLLQQHTKNVSVQTADPVPGCSSNVTAVPRQSQTQPIRQIDQHSISVQNSSQRLKESTHHVQTLQGVSEPATQHKHAPPAYYSSTPYNPNIQQRRAVHKTQQASPQQVVLSHQYALQKKSPDTVCITPTSQFPQQQAAVLQDGSSGQYIVQSSPTYYDANGNVVQVAKPGFSVLAKSHPSTAAVVGADKHERVVYQPVGNALVYTGQSPCNSPTVINNSSPAIIAPAHQQPQICTTKPYAVVNAIPTQSTSFKTLSPPLYSPPPPTLKTIQHSEFDVDAARSTRQTMDVRKNHPKALEQMPDIAQIREEATSDLTQRLQTFSNKYKDFDTLSPNELMDIFHSALKKFQRNSKMYDNYAQKVPLNITVTDKISSSTMQSTHQLASTVMSSQQHQHHHQSYQHHTTLAQNASHGSTAVVFVSQPSQPRYTTSTSLSHEQQTNGNKRLLAKQPSRTYQVQTSGVFVPPPSESVRRNSDIPATLSAAYKAAAQHHQQQQQQLGIMTSSNPQQTNQQHSLYTYGVPVATVQQHGNSGNEKIDSVNASLPVKSTTSTDSVIVNDNTSAVLKMSAEKRRRKPANINHILTNSVSSGNIDNEKLPSNNQKQQTTEYRNKPPKTDQSSTSSSSSKRQCSNCGKPATFLCSGCRKLWYCGRECQVKAWDQHSSSCKA